MINIEKELHLNLYYYFQDIYIEFVNDVKLILKKLCNITSVQQFSEGTNLILSRFIINIECHLTVG